MARQDKLLAQLQDLLDAGEKVQRSVFGAYETQIMGSKGMRNGVMAATDKRLVFYGKKLGGYDFEVFPYSQITSIKTAKGMLMGTAIMFTAAGNSVTLKWIKNGDARALVEYVSAQR